MKWRLGALLLLMLQLPSLMSPALLRTHPLPLRPLSLLLLALLLALLPLLWLLCPIVCHPAGTGMLARSLTALQLLE